MYNKSIQKVTIVKESDSYIDPSAVIYGEGTLILKSGARIEEGCTIGLGEGGSITIGKQSRITRSVLECNDYSIFQGHQSQEEIYYQGIGEKGGSINLGDYNAVAPFSLIIASLGGHIKTESHVNIMSASLEADGGTIYIGSYSYLNRYAVMNGMGNVTVGEHVMIAPHATFYSGNHITKAHTTISRQGFTTKGIILENDIWIAANVSIIDGAHIKTGCIIAANSVLNKPTEPNTVYAGVPAKKIKTRKDY